MINCAHPSHFESRLLGEESWINRIKGIRADASCKSHAELDQATELDDGNPEELGRRYRLLKQKLKHINIVGGYCGTDHRHVEHICRESLAA